MSEQGLYADPTFWAVHVSLERQRRKAMRPPDKVRLSPGVVRAMKRQRIKALASAAMAGKFKKKY
ncbi:hypothetical protein ACFPAG_07850 [Vogesella sp. GCM10023246]|uniref:Uncharacterized protein n=1 Tax=Vogesella oryzagri TaxID=3160864 RepID=A0ABV1M6F9_9NEIS